MSIAARMQQKIHILREMIERNNGDIINGGMSILDTLEQEVRHVEKLESITRLSTKEASVHQMQGEDNESENR